MVFLDLGSKAGSGSSTSKPIPKQALKSFIEQSPSSNYTFESKRESDHSEICRGTGGTEGGKDCVDIWLSSKQMFAAMQENGFFCALPMDPEKTHMECKPIPK
ncbi:hypothetical protein M422DRAFT_67521 [Sphaerobolus stellatus SS14]|uniref:Uncharacterized protein n=1 Tax=Sphaerobolus stellatus (strain SS14) TaxID=990650 RepID=A0A0C9W022_SPHS4|nr:hypothetical protein M422DRAFT_67521 [Sphaerobolus stellatus SS14]